MFLVTIGVAVPASAHDTGNGNGGMDNGGDIDVGITVTTPGVDSPVDLKGSTATQPIVWTVVDEGPASPGDLSHLCLAGPFDAKHS